MRKIVERTGLYLKKKSKLTIFDLCPGPEINSFKFILEDRGDLGLADDSCGIIQLADDKRMIRISFNTV